MYGPSLLLVESLEVYQALFDFISKNKKQIAILYMKFLQQEEKAAAKIKTESLLTSLADIPTEFSPLLGELLAGFMQKAGVPLPQVCSTGEGDQDKLKKGKAKAKKAGKKDASPDEKAPAEPKAQTAAAETLNDKKSDALPDKVTLFQVNGVVFQWSMCYLTFIFAISVLIISLLMYFPLSSFPFMFYC